MSQALYLLGYLLSKGLTLLVFSFIALSLLATTLVSADNLCKQLGPDQDRQNVGADLDPNCLIL